jgi:peptidoglycan/xylan/chitin deacetylase (PgdA/CDA1 family)
MCKRIKSKIRNGSIILMHNDTDYTAKGLQKILDTIREEGYEVVPLSELIYEDNYTINHEGRQVKNIK